MQWGERWSSRDNDVSFACDWTERQEGRVVQTVNADADADADRATSTEMLDRQCIFQ